MNLPEPKPEELRLGYKVDYIGRMIDEVLPKVKIPVEIFVDKVVEHYDKIYLGQNK